jgi:hypothetical protein
LKLKVSREPKVSALLRIFAGTCSLLWLVGILACGLDRVCNCAGLEGACAAHASPVHEREALSTQETEHSHEAEHHHNAEERQHATTFHHDGAAQDDHGCRGNRCGDQKRCCSTIQSLTVTPTPFVIEVVSQPALPISPLCVAREHTLTVPSTEALRQAKPRDWVFTPEVCLGPASHSLAPPALPDLNGALAAALAPVSNHPPVPCLA